MGRLGARTAISSVSGPTSGVDVYLVDSDVISEIRKGEKADPGVRAFFRSRLASQSREVFGAARLRKAPL